MSREHSQTEYTEYKELESLKPLVESMNADYAAWAWQIFLKRLHHGYKIGKARNLLYQELTEYSADAKIDPAILLDDDPTASKQELLNYFNGKISPGGSKFRFLLDQIPGITRNTILRNYDERERKAESYAMLLDAAKRALQKSNLPPEEKEKISAQIEEIEREVSRSSGEEQIDIYDKVKLKLIRIMAELNR